MMSRLLSRLQTQLWVLVTISILLVISYPAQTYASEIADKAPNNNSTLTLTHIDLYLEDYDGVGGDMTGIAEVTFDENEPSGYKVLQYVNFDGNGKASFNPYTKTFRSNAHQILAEMIFGADRSEFYYHFYWYWDWDFLLCPYLLGSDNTPTLIYEPDWVRAWGANPEFDNVQKDAGHGYPNHISFKVDQLKEVHPGLTNYGFIDADGNKTKDGIIELIPHYYFSNEYTTFKIYLEIDGKEYHSDLSLKVPGVMPLTCETSTQTAKLSNKDSNGHIISDIDNEFGHREYEEMKLTLENGKAFLPHKTGDCEYTFRHLPPDTEFEVTFIPYYVQHSTGKRMRIDGGKQPVITGKTATPYWTGGRCQVISSNKARVMYPTNIEQTTDSYVEWRVAGSTDETDIHRAEGPVVNGQLIGILEGLDPTANYECRPVYEIDGRRYAGDWVQVSTAGAEGWYEPAIYAQPSEIEEDESVTLRGAVLPGSGEVTEQGFEIWPQETAQNTGAAAGHRAEASHRFIPCEGISMSANLSDLTPGSTYLYRVYAKADGKTVTGNTASISVPGGVSDIGRVTVFEEETPEVMGYYNLQGVRSERPFDGMNIVIYSNGKTEKRVFKNL